VRATITLAAGLTALAFAPAAFAAPAPIPPPEAIHHAQQVAAAQQQASTNTTPAVTTTATVTPPTVTPVTPAPAHTTPVRHASAPLAVSLAGGRETPQDTSSATPVATPEELSTRSAALPAAPVPRVNGPVTTHSSTISGPVLAIVISLFVLVEIVVVVFAWRRASNPALWLRTRPHALAQRARHLVAALPVLPSWVPRHRAEHASAVGLVSIPPEPEAEAVPAKPEPARGRKRRATRSKRPRTRAAVTVAAANSGEAASAPPPARPKAASAHPSGPARA
jgi:hypothetical protein